MPVLGDADAVNLGTTEVDAMYLGADKVWPPPPPPWTPLDIGWQSAYWVDGPRFIAQQPGYGDPLTSWPSEIGSDHLNMVVGVPNFTGAYSFWNDKDVVYFNGASTLSGYGAALSQPWSLVVIGQRTGGFDGCYAGAQQQNATTARMGISRDNWAAGYPLPHADQPAKGVMVGRANGSSSKYHVNGVQKSSGDAGTGQCEFRRIGARNDALNNSFVGYIAFVGFYQGLLSAADETLLVDWSRSYYGTP